MNWCKHTEGDCIGRILFESSIVEAAVNQYIVTNFYSKAVNH